MNIISILRLINTILAATSLPPAILLMKHLIEERKAIAPGVRIVNKVLINSFILFSLAGMANAILSLLLFVNLDLMVAFGADGAQKVFNLRNLLVNMGYFGVSWGLWFVVFIKGREVKK